jgi:hypothetical protein
MTPERIAELKRLCDAATSGPWTVETPMDSPSVIADGNKAVYDWTFIAHIDTGKVKHSVKADRNAAFIAAAREALPALLAENKRLSADKSESNNQWRLDYNALSERAASAEAEGEQWRLAYNSLSERLTVAGAERDRLRAALTRIAAFDDTGANVFLESHGSYGSFDEPKSVEIARNALEQKP